jgi:RecG-like helicase
LGTRQSGQPWFKLADIIRDQPLLEQAAQEARKLLSSDPLLQNYPVLAAEIKRQQP